MRSTLSRLRCTLCANSRFGDVIMSKNTKRIFYRKKIQNWLKRNALYAIFIFATIVVLSREYVSHKYIGWQNNIDIVHSANELVEAHNRVIAPVSCTRDDHSAYVQDQCGYVGFSFDRYSQAGIQVAYWPNGAVPAPELAIALDEWRREVPKIREIFEIPDIHRPGLTDPFGIGPSGAERLGIIAVEKALNRAGTVGQLEGQRFALAGPANLLVYEEKLFANTEYEILIPSIYHKVEYKAPYNLDEYNSFEQNEGEEYCGERKAILIDEPHDRFNDEVLYFVFLDHLQKSYPDTFKDLYIFQEGQFSEHAFSYDALETPEFREMLEQSFRAWGNSVYGDLDTLTPRSSQGQILYEGEEFAESLDARLDRQLMAAHLHFYKTKHKKTGALNTYQALRNLITHAPSEEVQSEQFRGFVSRFEELRPRDTSFARYLLETIGFRGALAYELYVEGRGYRSTDRSVQVFGMEDYGMYLASCAMVKNCALRSAWQRNDETHNKWLAIQPARDQRMVEAVTKTMGDDPNDPRIPIIAANVVTHLPLIRELLCEQGYETETLAMSRVLPTEQPADWVGTTPIDGFVRTISEGFVWNGPRGASYGSTRGWLKPK